MSELEQVEAGIAALEAQRAVLGDAVVELAAAPLRARLEALRAQQAAAAQQLKQVSVMFVDTVGSTAMGQRLEPEDIHAIMDGALERYTAIVQGQRGRVLQYTGDGLLAAFGADEAREDDAERAIHAGLEILAEARRVASEVLREHGVAGFDVRVGIDTGPVLLGGGVDAEGSIRGSTVNMAARMEQSAPPGRLRIHHDTYRHVRGVFQVSEEPPLIVKGGGAPLTTYLVQGVKPRAFRVVTRGIEGVETRMVAREAEFEQLQETFHSVYAEPRLRAVTVSASAGIGKSRLLYEFENWAEAQPEQYVLFRGRAEPQTRTQPFGLMRDVLAWRLQIADDDDAETARDKLTRTIVPLFDHDGEAHAHLLGQLIGLDFSSSPHLRGVLGDARQLRNRAFHAAAQMLRQSAARTDLPVLLLLDDLHWADDASLDFVEYLVQVNPDVPLLMVCLTRPDLYDRRPDWRVAMAAHARIDLEPLDKRGSRELALVLLQRLGHVPVALRDLLISGADGNPFYMEELVRMLVDDGAIVATEPEWQVVPDKLLAAHVPPTLTGVLQARLDSLAPSEKRALQQASVIGFVFWEQALAALDPASPKALPALVRRGLLAPSEHPALEGQKEYVFAHQILHQVTYDSLLKHQRRDCHARVAAWLAQFSGDRATETLGPAAEHYARAGDVPNACRYFTRAAEEAAARYANEEMLGLIERAFAHASQDDLDTRWRLLVLRELCLLQRDDREAHAADLDAMDGLAERMNDDARRATVAMRRSATARHAGDFVAGEAAARQALARCGAPGLESLALTAHQHLAESLIGEGRYDEAREVSEQGVALACRLGDRVGESKLVNALGLIAMEQGDLTVAVGHFERGLAMVHEAGLRDDESARLNNLGSCYPRLGDYAKARAHLDKALAIARDTGQRGIEAAVLLNIASVAHLQGEDTAALTYAHAAMSAAVASGLRDLEAFARMVAGHAELGLGRTGAARRAYAESRDLLQSLRMRPQQALDPVSGLARVALADGRLAEAMEHVELLMAHVAAGGNFDGTEEPLVLPLTCWQVLSAARDPRAQSVLDAAVAELQAQAGRISDPLARRGFLDHVPHHRDLMAAWQRAHAAAPC